MRWLASNWFIILFVVGMAWMHLGHGGHGGHGSRHQQGPADRDEHGSGHGGHAGHGKPANPAPTPGDDRIGPTSTGPGRAV